MTAGVCGLETSRVIANHAVMSYKVLLMLTGNCASPLRSNRNGLQCKRIRTLCERQGRTLVYYKKTSSSQLQMLGVSRLLSRAAFLHD